MRNILRTISSILLAGAAFIAPAVTYHAPAIYDLKGDVRSFSVKTENPLAANKKKASFFKNGVQKNIFLVYSTDGHPLGNGLCLGNTLVNTIFFFQAGNSAKPDKILIQVGTADSMESHTLKYVYDGERVSEIYTENSGDKPHPTYRFLYSEEQYDSRGNWMTRNVRQIETGIDGNISETEYQETRKIKYYSK